MSRTLILVPGPGGLPKLLLAGPNGARAEMFLHGAHITSWIPADGRERLFLSEAAEFAAGKAIRGGVPVIFPQFAGEGPLVKHGFARTQAWEALDSEDHCARLRLVDNESTREIWPHAFEAELGIVLGGDQLAITLTIANTGHDSFTFTSALHTYLRVQDITRVAVRDLKGLRLRDSAQNDAERTEMRSEVRFEGEVDRIYFDAPSSLHVYEDGSTTEVHSAGFPEAVIWNPGPSLGAKMRDLEPEGYRRFVCVEAAAIGRPITLAPGESWQGSQTLKA